MVGVLIVSHGAIGRAILESARLILNETPPLVATLGVSRDDDPDDLRLRARRLIKQLDAGAGVVVLTDIFGATPGNVISRLLEDGRVEGVSGLSLPMLLRVLTSRSSSPALDLRGAVERAMSGGSEGVVHMNTDRCCDT